MKRVFVDECFTFRTAFFCNWQKQYSTERIEDTGRHFWGLQLPVMPVGESRKSRFVTEKALCQNTQALWGEVVKVFKLYENKTSLEESWIDFLRMNKT